MGSVYLRSGNSAQALNYFYLALDVVKELLRSNNPHSNLEQLSNVQLIHPQIAELCCNIGESLLMQNRMTEALENFSSAKDIYDKVFGKSNHYSLKVEARIADVKSRCRNKYK